MRRLAVGGAGALLLVGPTALAFYSGGYFAAQRTVAGVLAWLLVAIALAAGARLRGGRSTWLAFGGLAGLAVWTTLSILWAPVRGSAYGAGQIAFLYLGTFAAAALILGRRSLRGLIEPVLAGGTLIVIGYGLSARVLPGVLHFARSVSAQGRLEQPLTYWNAMGELAAIGFVLCARLAGDSARPRALRLIAVAGAAPLGAGLYISFSRGALFACVAGLIALTVLAPRTEQLAGTALCLLIGAVAAAAVSPFHGFTSLAGSLSTREGQGAIVFALMCVIALAGVAGQWAMMARGRTGPLRLPSRAALIATIVIGAGLALAIAVGSKESSIGSSSSLSGGATRLITLQSNRYAYWSVALRAFSAEPLRGVGAGGWAVWWLRWRTFSEFAADAHSLPLQTLAELGIVGLLLLAAFLAGVGLRAREALREDAGAAGMIAALVVYLVHSPLDWDWQMPAVTLLAIVLGGALFARVRGGGLVLGPVERRQDAANTIAPVTAP